MESDAILPGTGRWRAEGVTEGSHLSAGAVQVRRWDPSVASRHLPVPGRIWRCVWPAGLRSPQHPPPLVSSSGAAATVETPRATPASRGVSQNSGDTIPSWWSSGLPSPQLDDFHFPTTPQPAIPPPRRHRHTALSYRGEPAPLWRFYRRPPADVLYQLEPRDWLKSAAAGIVRPRKVDGITAPPPPAPGRYPRPDRRCPPARR